MRAIFCGTPEIAVPSLQALSEVAEIVGVVCQPDRPSGRGMKLSPPPVKAAALEMGLDVFQPIKVRDGSLTQWILQRRADVALVIAYGRILDGTTLAAPRLGCLNLHASLLPKYRGAAPIQRAIMEGESETGICLMQMDVGMDTGPVLARRSLPIAASDNTASLSSKLARLAADMTREELPRFIHSELSAQAQNESLASYAPPITKEECALNFEQPAVILHHRIRALAPRPGAYCFVDKEGTKRLKIFQTQVVKKPPGLLPGQIAEGPALVIACGDDALRIEEAQTPGRKIQSGEEILRGRVVQALELLH